VELQKFRNMRSRPYNFLKFKNRIVEVLWKH
jgi:hypothetical protein